MTIAMFRAKLHQFRVAEADLYYEGSTTTGEELLHRPRVVLVDESNDARGREQ